MKNEIIVLGEKENYKCYRIYPGNSDHSNLINNKLEDLRSTLKNLKYSNDVSAVNYELYVYESGKANALSKREAGGYIIAISSYLLFDIKEELVSYMNNAIKKYFYGSKLNARKHADKIHNYILLYIALHENYHILNGHCDGFYLINYASVQKRTLNCERNFNKQIIEMDADYCAVRSLIYLIDENTNRGVLESEILLGGFALYFIFLKFQEESYENITTININQLDHPPASIRMNYSFAVIITCLSNIINKEQLIRVINQLFELCVYFDRVYYDADSTEKTLFAYSFTQAGQEYVKASFDGWPSIKDKLSSAAYINLRDNDTVEGNNRHFLNSEGKLMRLLNLDKRMELMVENLIKL